MKKIMFPLVASLVLGLAAPVGAAECYADYKAKRDNPLKLHYGVAQISGVCSKPSAVAELRARLAANGWILLNVLSVFDTGGLAERSDSAGQYFLRF